jgi:mRNA-degrading endonuclease YafQ of YafQ-DinJ toxin-antitoxin module
MTYKLVYPDSYVKRAKKFLKKHREVRSQYQKTLELLEVNPHHPSLRFHGLQGRLNGLSSVSINMSYRKVLEMVIRTNDILLFDVGHHDQIY